MREDGAEPPAEETKFATLWKAFSKSIKLGVIEDAVNRARLSKLLRYQSTTQNVTTLEEYASRMPSWQAGIFFLAGESIEELQKSPFLERAKAKNVEVLLMGEPLDEYVVQNIPDFEGKKLLNLAKEGVKFGDESEDEAAREGCIFFPWQQLYFGRAGHSLQLQVDHLSAHRSEVRLDQRSRREAEEADGEMGQARTRRGRNWRRQCRHLQGDVLQR